jgi:hypothetical protein
VNAYSDGPKGPIVLPRSTIGSIGVRELRQNASHYLSRVAAGEFIEITDLGRPVARRAL